CRCSASPSTWPWPGDSTPTAHAACPRSPGPAEPAGVPPAGTADGDPPRLPRTRRIPERRAGGGLGKPGKEAPASPRGRDEAGAYQATPNGADCSTRGTRASATPPGAIAE